MPSPYSSCVSCNATAAIFCTPSAFRLRGLDLTWPDLFAGGPVLHATLYVLDTITITRNANV